MEIDLAYLGEEKPSVAGEPVVKRDSETGDTSWRLHDQKKLFYYYFIIFQGLMGSRWKVFCFFFNNIFLFVSFQN